MKKILMVIIILLIILGCGSEKPAVTIGDTSPNISDTAELTGIQMGDLVEINYVLYTEDNKIIDTNQEEIAKREGLNNYQTGVFKFIVGQSSKVKGFDTAIIGLEKGDKEIIEIPPTQKKIIIGLNRTKNEPRAQSIPKKQTFPKSKFERTFNKPPIVNDIVYDEQFPWSYKVVALGETSILAEIVIEEGDIKTLPGTNWPSQAFYVSDRIINFFQMPKDGQEIETEFGTAIINVSRSRMITTHYPELGKEFFYTLPTTDMIKPRYEFVVSEIKDDRFKITRTNYPAQERLKLDVEIIDVLSSDEIRKVR